MKKRRGKKETSDGGGGVEGQHGEGLRGLWEAAGDCVDFQAPGTGDDNERRRLARRGGQPVESAEELGRLLQIINREGADAKVSGNFFKAVMQAVLLFRAETWVLTPRIERALESFQHGAVRRITGRQPWRMGDGCWKYPPIKDSTREAGFKGIRKAITRRQNTVAQYITTRPIMYLCERATQKLGAKVS